MRSLVPQAIAVALLIAVAVAIGIAFLTITGCDPDPAPASTSTSSSQLLPSENPPTSTIPEPLHEPIPPPGFDPARARPRPLTAAQRAALDEADRLSAARARELAGVVTTPPHTATREER
jgi:hypothetical protein